jgi:hypothetical protein
MPKVQDQEQAEREVVQEMRFQGLEAKAERDKGQEVIRPFPYLFKSFSVSIDNSIR